MSYAMFGPVVPVRSDSNFGDLPRDPNDWGAISEHVYRTKDLSPEDYRRHGEIFHGPLAEDGKELFGEMAILSSALTGSGHTRDRFKAHYGSYKVDMKTRREPDERTVLQAFCEAQGRPYPFDQKEMIRKELWTPLKTFVRKLKENCLTLTSNSAQGPG